MQLRELSWMGRRFGELRLGNVRRPSALGGTRGPGSPRIAPGRNWGLPARGTQKASTLTLNAVATRGTDAAAPLRREEKWHGPYRGGLRAGTAIVPFIYSPSSQTTKLPHSKILQFNQGNT